MEVVERKTVPIYEIECIECKSKIRFQKSEVHSSYIKCPVCDVSQWVEATDPINLGEKEAFTKEKISNIPMHILP